MIQPRPPRIAVYPGTFDPLTMGHLDIIERACTLCDRLIVAVAPNRGKSPLFSLEERLEIATQEVASLNKGDTQILIQPLSGLLVSFAASVGAQFVVRGLRAVSDFEYEFQMAGMNARLAPPIETVFLIASDRCQFISSTLIKEITQFGGDVSQFVSPAIERRLRQKILNEPAGPIDPLHH
jgi:pantetheine-phosphate adenylyltransferase